MKIKSIINIVVLILMLAQGIKPCVVLANDRDNKRDQTEAVKTLLAEIANDTFVGDELKKKVKTLREILPVGTKKGALDDAKELRSLLFSSFPVLIKLMDGNVDNDAFIVMITVQTSCPPPKKEIWEQWLKKVKNADSIHWCWPVH